MGRSAESALGRRGPDAEYPGGYDGVMLGPARILAAEDQR